MDDIRLHPDPHLRVTCQKVTYFDGRIRAMAGEMLRVMYAGYGRGLAAPQIGYDTYDWRVFVMDAGWKDSDAKDGCVFVNPEITWASDDLIVCEEGCLSIPDQPRRVARPAEIALVWQDLSGKRCEGRFWGPEAVIIQHERDHLDGILILDHPEAEA